ncbi:hypothetical protein FLM48_03255 [Shewanella sp. Scap07]|uniref:hypothetical protein n=1 Tax=Shewanella sp. Scap07 TaxID=2589987 RepID=UPI0015B7E55E|nr:hypothetical protein [Shewanella sp. Scap07]QLE84185.1 hypothetical protein FLM48_03255 [Shewanella sp. Scap07]
MNITSQPPLIQSNTTDLPVPKTIAVGTNTSGGDMQPPPNSIRTSGGDMQPPPNSIKTSGGDMQPPPYSIKTSGGDMQPPPTIQEETFTYSRTPTGLAGPTVESNSDAQEATQPNVRVLFTA